jgi:hypothetical protein
MLFPIQAATEVERMNEKELCDMVTPTAKIENKKQTLHFLCIA